MARFPYQYVNINGVPTIQSRRVTVSTTSVDFLFRPEWEIGPFRGLILVYLSEDIPEGTTTTLPISFTMAGNTQNVTTASGDNWTVADVVGPGVYLFYCDRTSNILQKID